MKKVLRKILIVILVAIAIVSVSYTVIKDTEVKKNQEENKTQESKNVSNYNENNREQNEIIENKKNEEVKNEEVKNEEVKNEEKDKEDTENKNSQFTEEPKDYTGYKSNIEELINKEENKNVLEDLKSGENNLIYKMSDGSYYEYCFENDKIVNIYCYVECGNKSVAQYVLEAYTTEQMKETYIEAEIYKERAIKAKMSPKMIETYSNFTKEKLMNSMNKANKELKR